MAIAQKIDSNITGLAYAVEAELGYLPGENGNGGSPVWYRLNPNSYSDFGGQITTVAPNPINPSRQRRKGVTTDLEAAGGINHNLTFQNMTDLMQGMLFADIRRKARVVVTGVDIDSGNPDEYLCATTAGFVVGMLVKGTAFTNSANNAVNVITVVTTDTAVKVATGNLVTETPPAGAYIDVVGVQSAAGDVDVSMAGDLPVLTSTTLDFTTLGLVPGQWIYLGGDLSAQQFSTAANNGFKRIRTIAAHTLTIDKSDTTMVTEANTTKTVRIYFGDVLRNESGTLIKRRSYNVERTLGVPDTASPSQVQSEVLKGAIPSEFTLNLPSADLASVDFSFMALDNEQRVGATGPKQTSVKVFPQATEYNTSVDIGRVKLATVSSITAIPEALFGYVMEAKITINNNLSGNKALGVLGSFEVTAGTFEVSGSITAYFSNVTATQAIRNNANVTLDVALVKNNTAMIFDLPLIALGDGRLNVELDAPITLPLNTDAASGEDVDTNLDHTLLITYFNYVPNAAM